MTERNWQACSDEDLLAATATEPDAFGAFYRRHEDAILGYLLRRVGDPELAIDLTAESFAAALRSAHRFRPGPDPARAWLFGIARNTLAMSLRRRRVETRARRRLGLTALAVDDEAIERVLELSDGSLLELVDALPDEQRSALTARVVVPHLCRHRDRAALLGARRAQARQSRPRSAARAAPTQPAARRDTMSRLPDLERQLVAAAGRRSGQRRRLRLPSMAPGLGRARVLLSAGGLATIAAIAVVALLSGGTRSGDSAAAAALREVAAVARSKPVAAVPGKGQFVYVRSRAVNLLAYTKHGPFRLRGDVFAYGAVLTTVREQWVGAGAGRQRFHESGPVLASRRDRRAWIAAGRPPLLVRSGSPPDALEHIDRARPLDLPANPDALFGRMKRTYSSHGDRVYAFMFAGVADALRDPNASAAQRAALLEVAARLPGVQLLGARTDSAGRHGLGFAMREPQDTFRLTLIIDPHTSLLLSQIQEAVAGNAIPAGTVTSRQTFGAPRIVAAIGSAKAVPPRRP